MKKIAIFILPMHLAIQEAELHHKLPVHLASEVMFS